MGILKGIDIVVDRSIFGGKKGPGSVLSCGCFEGVSDGNLEFVS